MSLSVGARLGHYTVTAKLGAGGMGEVWEATDTTLHRQVALKILPEAFATDPDRLARFQREAQVLGSLNHPNIAGIHGIEEAEDTRALVLELVEGPTLADRIKRGPIPVDDALPIAKQIAEALEAAHEAGVIHRDLKPANIKVREDGTVKVLDFGLARAFQPDPVSGDLSQSPTLTAAATQAGVIMGTAAYMSPEQARGKPVDKRTDIWAFGAVLFEMITGQPAFDGTDIGETLAAVIKLDPDLAALPDDAPESIRRLLVRSLLKDPSQRLRDIGDARFELASLESASATTDVPGSAVVGPGRGPFSRRSAWLVTVLVAGGVGALAMWVGLSLDERGLDTATAAAAGGVRLEIPLGPEHRLVNFQSRPAVSPDGRVVAYAVSQGGEIQIFLRSLDGFESRPVEGTEGGGQPFFSPDGEELGFVVRGNLYKVPVDGGNRLLLAEELGFVIHPMWGSGGQIVYGAFESGAGIGAVPEDGGTTLELTTVDAQRGEQGHGWPHVLPDGTVLFSIRSTDGSSQLARYFPDDATWAALDVAGTGPFSYLASGHLIFQRSGAVLAVPFNLDAGEVLGSPRQVLGDANWAHLAVSTNGTAAYLHFPPGGGKRLVRVSRDGVSEPLVDQQEEVRWPRLSPDGRRLAVGMQNIDEGRLSQVWLIDLGSGRRTLLQEADGLTNRSEPVWSPDGQHVVYASARAAGSDLYWQRSDGGGMSTVLSEEPFNQWPTSFSSDGRRLAFYDEDIYVLSLDDGVSTLAVAGPGRQRAAKFSPDDRWLAYSSDHTGRTEIYMRPLPDLERLVAVSTEGGRDPVWSRDGRELFYRRGSRMMVVRIVPELDSPVGEETVLFEGEFEFDSNGDQSYDVFPDGQHFVMVQQGEALEPRLRLATGLLDEVGRRTVAN